MSVITKWVRRQFRGTPGAAYYQQRHQTGESYQTSNKLLPDVEALLATKPRSVLEIGCGNGRFLAAIKPHVENVTGVDWARSPMIDALGLAENFRTADVIRDTLPKADLVCSADVLEHISRSALPSALQNIHSAGPRQYHIIACYDDGYSHLSIMPPAKWLDQFRAVSPAYNLIGTRTRGGKGRKVALACVIANFAL